MVSRQNGKAIVHYDDGAGVVCRVGKQGSYDPRETTCGHCCNTDVWKRAWHAEAKRAKVPTL